MGSSIASCSIWSLFCHASSISDFHADYPATSLSHHRVNSPERVSEMFVVERCSNSPRRSSCHDVGQGSGTHVCCVLKSLMLALKFQVSREDGIPCISARRRLNAFFESGELFRSAVACFAFLARSWSFVILFVSCGTGMSTNVSLLRRMGIVCRTLWGIADV